MKLFSHYSLLLLLVAIFFSSRECIAQSVKINPHSDAADCALCHVASVDKLRSWFVFGSTKRELKYDLNQVCQKCHMTDPTHAGGYLGVGIGHAIGKKPAINKENLPLASDGTITCAKTCHKMHVTSNDFQQQRKHLIMPVNSLCVSCHDK